MSCLVIKSSDGTHAGDRLLRPLPIIIDTRCKFAMFIAVAGVDP